MTQAQSSHPFSVLMSLYHKERPEYLTACFDSLIQQSQAADEIVLVLDGAIGDELMQVLEHYRVLLPIKTVALPENVGLGRALNHGLAAAQHEWVLRMDTDDVCHPQRFERQMIAIDQRPNVALLGTQIAEFDVSPDMPSAQRCVPTDAVAIRDFARVRNPFNHMTVAYRKTVVMAVGGYQDHSYLEDYNLWLRIMAQGHIVANVSEVLLYARTAGDALLRRRRGWSYVRSEWRLARLKQQLGVQTVASSVVVFVLRAVPRLLPVGLLRPVYRALRKEQ